MLTVFKPSRTLYLNESRQPDPADWRRRRRDQQHAAVLPRHSRGWARIVSGMASADENGRIVPDTFENEARRTYRNAANILQAAGLRFADVVQVRCYLQNKQDWDAHNRIYREFFTEPYPARTTLIGCLGDIVKYEVDLIAYAGEQPRTPEK